MPTPTPEETQAVIDIPHGAAYDWITWAVQGCIVFLLGVAAKLFHDVQKLKTAKEVNDATCADRDRQRVEILEVVKEVRDELREHKKEVREEFKEHKLETQEIRKEILYLRREKQGDHL